ncbi:MAG: 6-carboxytetrahydropterin synthase [Bacteroidota bacterium]|nr:6-carboxytetrahydropterin synthase [Bacteroidota bacterium]
MCYITRKEHFNAAHRLRCEDWSTEQNEEIFGRCANANWHGHNFTLYVTVKGIPDPKTGFIVNLKHLSEVIKERITDKVDHRNLNVDVDFMRGIMPSIENFVMAIWQQMEDHIKGGTLYCIKLVETENNYVEYYGEPVENEHRPFPHQKISSAL